MQVHFILYVSDQKASAGFYERVLASRPQLDVPGMTEFRLNDGSVLGLMPGTGIKRLLGDRLPDPAGRARSARRLSVFRHRPPTHFSSRAASGSRALLPASQEWEEKSQG